MDIKNTDFAKMKHNLCFLVLEGAVMIPLLVMNFSWIHAAAYVILGGYLINLLIFKEQYQGNPGALFSRILLVDLFLIGFLHMDYLWQDKQYINTFLNLFLSRLVSGIILLVILGGVLTAFYKVIKLRNIFLWAILEVCMTVRVIDIYQDSGNRIKVYLIIFYSALSAIWIFSERLSILCTPNSKTQVGKRTTGLFLLFFVLVSIEFPPLINYLSMLPQNYQIFGERYMSSRVIVLAVVLAGVLGYILQPGSKKEQQGSGGASTLFLWGFGGFCLVLKCSQAFYFTYGWGMLILYLLVFYVLFQRIPGKHYKNYKFYGLEVPLAAVGEGVLMYLINRGLWMLALAVLLSGALIFLRKDKETLQIRLLIAWLLMAEGILFGLRGCTENYLAALIIVICGTIVTTSLHWPHPAGLKPKKDYMVWMVNVAVIILLLIPCFSRGSDINAQLDQTAGTVNISVEARGKENQIRQSYYYWRDGKGKKVSENIPFQGKIENLQMANECLTIVTMDKNNIWTERKVWFPYEFYNVKN